MGTVNTFPLTTVLYTEALALPPRIVTSGATIIVDPADRIIALNYAGATSVTLVLPPVADRETSEWDLEVYDFAGNITNLAVTPDSVLSEKVMGATTAYNVASGGSAQTGFAIRLKPSVTLNGWLVK